MPDPAILDIDGVEYLVPPTAKAIRLRSAAGTVLFTLDPVTGALVTAGGITNAGVQTTTGLITAAAGLRIGTGATVAGVHGLGTPEQATIATDVLTVTRPYANVLPESGSADAVTSIVYAAALEGDYLQCMSTATNTITFTRTAGLVLGAATRAVAPGGSILLQLVGANWVERAFLAAAS